MSLPGGAGLRPNNWLWERSLIAKKTCKHCATEFQPHRWKNKAGRIYVQTEKSWDAQEFCSIACGKKAKNPMKREAVRNRVSATLKRIGHKPTIRGGNGTALTEAQSALLRILGGGWKAELAITTGLGKKSLGYPGSYKVDIGNQEKKIAIEVDGKSHNLITRRALDKKKTEFLNSLGWSVYRVSNTKALSLCSTFTSADTLLTSLTGS